MAFVINLTSLNICDNTTYVASFAQLTTEKLKSFHCSLAWLYHLTDFSSACVINKALAACQTGDAFIIKSLADLESISSSSINLEPYFPIFTIAINCEAIWSFKNACLINSIHRDKDFQAQYLLFI